MSLMGKRRTRIENKTFKCTDCCAKKINKSLDEIAFCLDLCLIFIFFFVLFFAIRFPLLKFNIFIKIWFIVKKSKTHHYSHRTITMFHE